MVDLFDVRLPDRFWAKVSPEPNSGCWLWTASIDGDGYARFTFEQKHKYAHRVAYVQAVGPVQPGFELDHLCRNRACVNPNHLEAVTHAENVRRSQHPHSPHAHCKRGHVFSVENSYFRTLGEKQIRQCRICTIEKNRTWRAARKQAGDSRRAA